MNLIKAFKRLINSMYIEWLSGHFVRDIIVDCGINPDKYYQLVGFDDSWSMNFATGQTSESNFRDYLNRMLIEFPWIRLELPFKIDDDA